MWPPRVLLTAVTAGLGWVCGRARAHAFVYMCASFFFFFCWAWGCPCYKKEARIMAALSHIFPFFSGSFAPSPFPPLLPSSLPLPHPSSARSCRCITSHPQRHVPPTVMFLKGALCMNYCSFLVCRPAVGALVAVWQECDPRTAYCSLRIHGCGPSGDDAGEPHGAF